MIESVGFDALESIFEIQKVNRSQQADKVTGPLQAIMRDSDTAEISPIGQIMSSIEQMDDQTKADFQEFMENMHEQFKSGNFDTRSLAASASDNLINFAESIGLDLTEAIDKFAEFVQVHGPMGRQPVGDSDQMAQNLIDNLDENGDGVLSSDEFGIPKHIFDKMDSNSDGLLDKEELKAPGQMGPKGNKAGKGSQNDQNTTEQVTATFDTDGDGIADTEEVTTYGASGEVQSIESRPISSTGNVLS